LVAKRALLRVPALDDLNEDKLDEYLALIGQKLNADGGKDWNCLSDAERTAVTAYAFALD